MAIPNYRSGRKIPKPFKRNAIDLSPVDREWRTVEASSLLPGDTIPSLGVIRERFERDDGTLLLVADDAERSVDSADHILAFVKKEL